MKNTVLSLCLLLSFTVQAQYYYNDIVGTAEIEARMKSYAQNKVRTVRAIGSDANGTKSTDFDEYQEVQDNGKALRVVSRNGFARSIQNYQFDDKGKLIRMTDSSNVTQSVSRYNYDASGRIQSIENTMLDTSKDFNDNEIHYYQYNSSGKPLKLWRIRNGSDSLEVRFTLDENGNVSDEQVFRNGVGVDPVHYYYDDNNRLSDIVRYNKKLKKLMPDMMFEYDENNRVIQKITPLPQLTLGYVIWRYIYDGRGLKTKEALFNRDKQLTGKIDYTYTLAQ